MAMHSVDWSPYLGHDWNIEWDNKIDIERLKSWVQKFVKYPESPSFRAV